MFSNSERSGSKVAGVIVNLIAAIVGGIIGSSITVYMDKYVDWEMNTNKYFETAYYQAVSVKEVFNLHQELSDYQLPVNKLITSSPDWNDIFFEIQDEKVAKTYFKLCYLDDLRDKIFQASDLKDKKLLCSEYWKVFDEIKSSRELDYFVDKLNYYRYSSENKRRQEELEKQQEELKKQQEEREKANNQKSN